MGTPTTPDAFAAADAVVGPSSGATRRVQTSQTQRNSQSGTHQLALDQLVMLSQMAARMELIVARTPAGAEGCPVPLLPPADHSASEGRSWWRSWTGDGEDSASAQEVEASHPELFALTHLRDLEASNRELRRALCEAELQKVGRLRELEKEKGELQRLLSTAMVQNTLCLDALREADAALVDRDRQLATGSQQNANEERERPCTASPVIADPTPASPSQSSPCSSQRTTEKMASCPVSAGDAEALPPLPATAVGADESRLILQVVTRLPMPPASAPTPPSSSKPQGARPIRRTTAFGIAAASRKPQRKPSPASVPSLSPSPSSVCSPSLSPTPPPAPSPTPAPAPTAALAPAPAPTAPWSAAPETPVDPGWKAVKTADGSVLYINTLFDPDRRRPPSPPPQRPRRMTREENGPGEASCPDSPRTPEQCPCGTSSLERRERVRRALSLGGCDEETCARCHEPVSQAGRITAQGNLFHKACFRCSACECALSSTNWYTDLGGALFCKAHHLQARPRTAESESALLRV